MTAFQPRNEPVTATGNGKDDGIDLETVIGPIVESLERYRNDPTTDSWQALLQTSSAFERKYLAQWYRQSPFLKGLGSLTSNLLQHLGPLLRRPPEGPTPDQGAIFNALLEQFAAMSQFMTESSRIWQQVLEPTEEKKTAAARRRRSRRAKNR